MSKCPKEQFPYTVCDFNCPVHGNRPSPPAEPSSVEDARAWLKANPWSDDLADDMALYAEQYATKHLERQTPAIIERFVEEVEKELLDSDDPIPEGGGIRFSTFAEAMRKVAKTRTNSTEIEGDINQ